MGRTLEEIVQPRLEAEQLATSLGLGELIFVDSRENKESEDARVSRAIAEIAEAQKKDTPVAKVWHIITSLQEIFPSDQERLDFAKRFFVTPPKTK